MLQVLDLLLFATFSLSFLSIYTSYYHFTLKMVLSLLLLFVLMIAKLRLPIRLKARQ